MGLWTWQGRACSLFSANSRRCKMHPGGRKPRTLPCVCCECSPLAAAYALRWLGCPTTLLRPSRTPWSLLRSGWSKSTASGWRCTYRKVPDRVVAELTLDRNSYVDSIGYNTKLRPWMKKKKETQETQGLLQVNITFRFRPCFVIARCFRDRGNQWARNRVVDPELLLNSSDPSSTPQSLDVISCFINESIWSS